MGATKREIGEGTLLGSVLEITALVYAATIRFQFVYDDHGQIVQNTLVQSWRFVPQYFQGQVWQYLFSNALANYYRPLNLLWFRLNDALFGLQPAGWHVLAILLHVFATALAYLIARRLAGRPLMAALTALLFGVHPMRHEVVAWVSGTTESLCAVLFLSGFLAYLKSRETARTRWMALSGLLYAVALLVKETAIVLPAVIFTHAWLYGGGSDGNEQPQGWIRLSRAARRLLVYVPVAILYLAVRVSVLDGFSHSEVNISPWTFALTLPSVLFFYVRQWLLPIRVAAFYDLPLASRIDVTDVVLPLAGLILLSGALWFFRWKLGRREVAFAALWTVTVLLPALSLSCFRRANWYTTDTSICRASALPC